MSKFIKLPSGSTERIINKDDIVSVEKTGNRVEINYRKYDETGVNPYIIECISIGITDSQYQDLTKKLLETD